MRPQNVLLLKDKLNLNHLMRSRTGLWPGRLFFQRIINQNIVPAYYKKKMDKYLKISILYDIFCCIETGCLYIVYTLMKRKIYER